MSLPQRRENDVEKYDREIRLRRIASSRSRGEREANPQRGRCL